MFDSMKEIIGRHDAYHMDSDGIVHADISDARDSIFMLKNLETGYWEWRMRRYHEVGSGYFEYLSDRSLRTKDFDCFHRPMHEQTVKSIFRKFETLSEYSKKAIGIIRDQLNNDKQAYVRFFYDAQR